MFEMYRKGNPASTALILTIIKNIAEKYLHNIVDFFPQLCDDKIFKPDSMNIRSSILACVGGVDEVCVQNCFIRKRYCIKFYSSVAFKG